MQFPFIQAILEVRAGSVRSMEQFNDLVRSWLSNINADDHQRGNRYLDKSGEEGRQLTFTQVLVRGGAIDELLAMIACQSGIRTELGAAWKSVKDDSPDGSPMSDRTHAASEFSEAQLAASQLYQLLARTLVGGEESWFDLVVALLSLHGHDGSNNFEDEGGLSYVAFCERSGFRSVELPMLSRLKRDWLDDWLESERRELAVNLDQKRAELVNLSSGGVLWDKIRLSGDIVDLYELVKDNLDVCTMRRSETRKETILMARRKREDAKKALEEAKAERERALERQEIVEKNSQVTESDFRPKLEAILQQRSAIDACISKLETEKQRLKQELERVSGELADAQAAQRKVMESESNLRAEIGSSRTRFASMLIKELKEEKEEETDIKLLEKDEEILSGIEKKIDEKLSASSLQLAEIYTQFDNAFIEAVQEHLAVLNDAIDELFRVVKRLCEDLEAVNRAKSSQSLSRMLSAAKEADEKEEFDAGAERLSIKYLEIETKLRSEAAEEVDKFNATFITFYKRFESKFSSNRLLNGEVDKIKQVLTETQALVNKYAVYN